MLQAFEQSVGDVAQTTIEGCTVDIPQVVVQEVIAASHIENVLEVPQIVCVEIILVVLPDRGQ